ncbi:MAG: YicC family protein [Clostridia bacterium]|nr:YicC family protein [Clostridia bacterium]
MIRSMTGFGRSKYEISGREYIVDIKSVNHKYSDISIKMPRAIIYLEDKVRKEVLANVSRGKIDVFISMQDFSETGKEIKLNKQIAKAYINELKALANETDIDCNINVTDISRFPDVLSIKDEENEELIWSELKKCLDEAIKNFITMREIEGNKMKEDIKNRLESISKKISEISNFSSGLIEEYIIKLNARVKELMKSDIVDENRLAQEIVIFSDKSSIEEELTRLNSHLSQFISLLENSSPIGKKFDFIVQEMNREINTIGSKANCLEITNRVIEIKTELENVREQIQNIE